MRDHDADTSFRKRVSLLCGAFAVWVLVILWTVLSLVAFKSQRLERIDAAQNITEPVPARRGTIFDRRGHELAISVTTLDTRQADLFLSEKTTRLYPEKTLASQLLGSTAVNAQEATPENGEPDSSAEDEEQTDDSSPSGSLQETTTPQGVEGVFDEKLNGEVGLRITPISGRVPNAEWLKPPRAGTDIAITIDKEIQYIAEQLLKRAVNDSLAQSGSLIVQAIKTGDVLAVASYPPFDPNETPMTPMCSRKNWALEQALEPGSFQRLPLIASALETRPVSLRASANCKATLPGSLNTRLKQLFDMRDLKGVVSDSGDTCSIGIAASLGQQRLLGSMTRFGFGARTGIELKDDSGTIPSELGGQEQVAVFALGQGLRVTPLQINTFLAAIANGGIRVTPHVLLGTAPQAIFESAFRFRPQSVRIMSSSTALQLRDLLSAKLASPGTPEVRIAGIGAIAWRVGDAEEGYDTVNRVVYFSGFAPADTPEIAATVTLDSPLQAKGNLRRAASVIKEAIQQSLEQLGTPVSNTPELQDPGPDPDPAPELAPRDNLIPVRMRSRIALLRPDGTPTPSAPGLADLDTVGNPILTGVSDLGRIRSQQMKLYMSMLRVLSCAKAPAIRVLEIDASDMTDVRLIISDDDGKLLVHLGLGNWFSKFQVLIHNLARFRRNSAGLKAIDLRNPGQITVTPKSGSSHVPVNELP